MAVTTRPLLCLVTDRRRLAQVVGRDRREAFVLLLAQLEGAIRGGIDIVQIREHDLAARPLAALAGNALRLARGSTARVVVNDRIDVAIATGVHGVHLREASPRASRVRGVWPTVTIGRSVHSQAAMQQDRDVDYWIAGTVFRTESKPAADCLGIEGLQHLVTAADGVPVLAIGGITETTLGAVVRAGANGIAAIGAFLPPAGVDDIAAAAEQRVRALRFAFDEASAIP
jgi:thiamine-phosphate diphosphorylase